MANWADRLAKLAQALATAGTVPDTSVSTAETDVDLRLAPDGAGGVEWGTGGAGGGVASPDWWHSDNAPGSPNAANKEFTEGTTVGTLTRVANGTPRGTWTETLDGLFWEHTVTTGAELDVYATARTCSIGDYVTIAFSQAAYNPVTLGAAVGFSDGTTYGTSNAASAFAHMFNSVTMRHMMNNWPGHNTRAVDSTIQDYGFPGQVWGIRVKYEAANTWGLYIRAPGMSVWRTIQTNYAYTMTPTHVIFGASLLTATFAAGAGAGIRLECFRVND